MQPDLLPGHRAASVLHNLRLSSPLVHCMTNDVVQNFTANVLLAIGASPAMVIEAEEAAQFSPVADSLLINIGTLTAERSRAMLAAIHAANDSSTPWVLDPVAVGGLSFRTQFARDILSLRPAAIRGNASEILVLAGDAAGGRGVDSTSDSSSALPAALHLAQLTGAIVAVTGELDYVTDGVNSWAVAGGDILMTRVVGTGCALSAVVAACCSLSGSRLDNVAAACRFMKFAGRRAIAAGRGPGSFSPAFLDALYLLNEEALA
ncbi:hydroxyethylthiazole kinase [Enterobacteriaceae bacterium H20N1]|uniref:Hydroxyethylthiazole kinase n=1 Tax=Dryocola boscaweniae TaxID=2925397 RepID=A0A9X2W9D5_9ENTR|nr:hydroxyethylthiazole kinase [Dryocola boscaweniae]MCT4702538.1 hydroxyethylthiazole kinase [Dryocola boscaweniae]MCT4719706.1 hydroxyethylthiazole kinase [Dryocola boscaweniae]